MLPVDVEAVDRTRPRRACGGAVLGQQFHRVGQLCGREVLLELVTRLGPTEQPPVHEGVDRDDLPAGSSDGCGQDRGRAALVTPDLDDERAIGGQLYRGVPQQLGLRLGEPAGDLRSGGPRVPELRSRAVWHVAVLGGSGRMVGTAYRLRRAYRPMREADAVSDGAATHRRPDARNRILLRVVAVAVVVLTLALNLAQQPGLVTFDTKLDLQFDPGGFLARSLSLWNADSAVGGLQNQASGYLFPMGPAFWVGSVLGVPMWVWERLWSAAVMLIAYEGTRRLAARWPGIGSWGAVVAGLAYMLAPRVLVTVGGLSGETLPTAVLPWTVLPLLLYFLGHVRPSVAFLWSAATVSLMGGQNATLVFACLLLPALLLLLVEGRSWGRRLRDLVLWGALVVLASLWWVIPLFLLGAYAPPFLDFIESAHNTASNIGWLTSLRGTGHWVAFFPGGGSAGWAGGYEIVSSPVLLFTTALTAGVGLVGLVLPGLWARRALVIALAVGLVVLTLGNGGWAGSALSEWWLDTLDGGLAPLRNIHKFDPLVRLPLSLGSGPSSRPACPS